MGDEIQKKLFGETILLLFGTIADSSANKLKKITRLIPTSESQ